MPQRLYRPFVTGWHRFQARDRIHPPPRPLVPLNFEIQVKVLGHIPDTKSLISCCLVCKAWCRICQRRLLRTVHIVDHQKLERLWASLFSATHPIGTYITHLTLYYHPCRISPFYLATRLTSLQSLYIIRPFVDDPFVVQSSLVMHLKHFRTVTELTLFKVKFQSFWDFRRFIVALPSLSTLNLVHVDLVESNPFQRPICQVPSLYTFPQNLFCLIVDLYSSINPLWVWTTLFQSRQQNLTNPRFHPFLTLHDADIIWEFDQFVRHSSAIRRFDGSKYKWSLDEDHQCECIVLVY